MQEVEVSRKTKRRERVGCRVPYSKRSSCPDPLDLSTKREPQGLAELPCGIHDVCGQGSPVPYA